MPENFKKQALSEALAAARQTHSEWRRAEALSALTDKLPELLPEALAAARHIQYDKYSVEVLSALAEKLTQMT